MWAMIMQAFVGTTAFDSWLSQERWLLLILAIATIVLEVSIIVEAFSIRKKTPALAGRGFE